MLQVSRNMEAEIVALKATVALYEAERIEQPRPDDARRVAAAVDKETTLADVIPGYASVRVTLTFLSTRCSGLSLAGSVTPPP